MSLTVRLALVLVVVACVGLLWLWSQRHLRRRLERETGHPHAGPWPPGRRVRDMTPLGKGLLALMAALLLVQLTTFVVDPSSRLFVLASPALLLLGAGAAVDETRRVKRL